MHTSMLPPRAADCEPALLDRYFDDTWRLYEQLFAAVSDDAMYEAPDPLRNPLVFYLGHTAAFYINKLVAAGVLSEGLNPHFEEIFARGVDPATAAELDVRDQWPALDQVREYRRQVHAVVHQVIADTPASCATPDSPLWALLMGFEHDRIHWETSSVLIRQLPVHQVQRPADWRYADDSAPPAPRFLEVPGATVQLGRAQNGEGLFGWDNEYGALEVQVKPFAARADLVTNARYLEFVRDGGYSDASHWSPEGWSWRREHDVQHPRFWRPQGDGFAYRAMFDELPLPLSWPAEVNAHEATAFCHWEGSRLMTEAEHLALRVHAPLCGDDCIDEHSYNLNLRLGSPTPVGALGRSALGFSDVFGNVWQWLADNFRPLPGFAPHPLYHDFSEPYFDDRHAVLCGGSWASTGTSASRWYRLWFRRHFYQHAGFRPARDL